MTSFASPLEIAAAAAAVGWPLAAGLGVVLWSRRRASRRQQRLAAVDAELQTMFRSIEATPAPDRLTLVVEALDEAEAMNGVVAAKPAPKSRQKA